MATVTPSSLPTVDAVEIVSLRGIEPNHVDGYMTAARDVHGIRVVGIDAQRVAALWRTLPAGEQKRCHVPPFGLRFYERGRLICQASICWECNNIFGQADTDEVAFEFDANGEPSRELYEFCKTAVGKTVMEYPPAETEGGVNIDNIVS